MCIWLPDQRAFGCPPQNFELDKRSPLARGLVGYWPLAEGGGTVARDYSGHGNHGTLLNFPTGAWTINDFGRYLHFDAVDSYVSLSRPITGQQGTVSAWIWPDDLGTACWFSEGTAAATSPYLMCAIFSSSLCLYTQVARIKTVQDLVAQRWNHVAITSDGSQYRFFIDGLEYTDLTIDFGVNNGAWFDDFAGDTWSIGILDRDSDYGPFDGGICEVMVHDYPLSPGLIWSLYNPSTRWQFRQPTDRMPGVFVSGGAPPAGLSIPIAMHHYKQMMGAN